MMTRFALAALLAATALAAGCGSDDEASSTVDTAAGDVGNADSSATDTGSPDGGATDVGAPDTSIDGAGTPDSTAEDVGIPDTGNPQDIMTEDSAGTDVSAEDVAVQDVQQPEDVSPTDVTAGDADAASPDVAVNTCTPDCSAGFVCNDGVCVPDLPNGEFKTLIEYVEGEVGNYVNDPGLKLISADELHGNLGAWKIIDLRSSDMYGPDDDGVWQFAKNGVPDYYDGHVPGAVLVPLADLPAYAAANLSQGDKVVVICWTGHSAGHGTMVLNLLGIDAYSLRYGMSSWHPNFDKWSSIPSSDYDDLFTTDPDPGKNPIGTVPTLSTGLTTGKEILDARIADLLANKSRLKNATDVLAAPDDYYIINYWPEDQYLGFGHLTGAHDYAPGSLSSVTNLLTLPTDMPIVVYSYAGQADSQLGAYLTVLGYDAYGLRNGVNGIAYDKLPAEYQWQGPADFTYETSEMPCDPSCEDGYTCVKGTCTVVAPPGEFKKLIEYVEGAGGNTVSGQGLKLISAAELEGSLGEWKILDVRSSDMYGWDADGNWQFTKNGVPDYYDGHVPGAVLVPLAELPAYAATHLSKTDKVVVICWTGHSAGHGTMALGLLGYDAYALRYGMSSWHPNFDKWSTIPSSDYMGQFTTEPDTGKNPVGDYPTVDTGLATGQEILAARVTDLLANKSRLKNATEVLAAPDDYYIVNYWPEDQYLGIGHLPGAHDYAPGSLSTTTGLATLPTDKPIVVYSYAGQQDSQLGAFLTVLGYDAYGLRNGVNGIAYDALPAEYQWPGPANFAFETSDMPCDPECATGYTCVKSTCVAIPPAGEFKTLVEYLEGEAGNSINVSGPKLVSAAELQADPSVWKIIDVRSSDLYGPDGDGLWQPTANGIPDYYDGHVPGAVLVPLAEIPAYAAANLSKADKVVVICWTGQSAGHGALALNLLGYDAYALDWGMSSWNVVFDKWSSTVGSDYADMLVTDPDPGMDPAGTYPTLATGFTTGPEILAARIESLLGGKTRLIKATDVLAAVDDYYLINYWPVEEYLGIGHLPTAHDYEPGSLSTAGALVTLPVDQPIVVYSYTGQEDSQLGAFLTILGYDAYGLRAGVNGIAHDALPAEYQWPGAAAFTYESSIAP